MSEELKYIIWYHRLLGKTVKGRKALEYYGSYRKLYDALVSGDDTTKLISSSSPGKFQSYSLLDAEKVIDICQDNGWEIIPVTSPYYPEELLGISDYPHILFCDGDKEILTKNIKFAIVGSRQAVADAEVIAYNAAYNLASTGAVIVSGAAEGIDSAAHLGAVKSGGFTIGVLGCGLGNAYIKKISSFYEEIKQSGVYITECFPFAGITPGSFPDRNRIISGLSRGVLVTCAATGSGTLNTARHAKKQKRSIFVLAPEICYSKGCEELLNDGAFTFYNAGDMAYPNMNYYKDGSFNSSYCNKPVTPVANSVKREDMALPKRTGRKTSAEDKPERVQSSAKNIIEDKKTEPLQKNAMYEKMLLMLSDNAKMLYEYIGDEPLYTEELVRKSSLPAVQVQIAVSELEAMMLIKCLPGGRVQRK